MGRRKYSYINGFRIKNDLWFSCEYKEDKKKPKFYNGYNIMCRLVLIKLWIWLYCRRCDPASSTCLLDGDKLPETEMKIVNFRCKEKDGGFHRERSIGFLLYSWKTVYIAFNWRSLSAIFTNFIFQWSLSWPKNTTFGKKDEYNSKV